MYLQRATASLIPYWSASIQKNQPWSLIGWREYKPISPNLLKIDEKSVSILIFYWLAEKLTNQSWSLNGWFDKANQSWSYCWVGTSENWFRQNPKYAMTNINTVVYTWKSTLYLVPIIKREIQWIWGFIGNKKPGFYRKTLVTWYSSAPCHTYVREKKIAQSWFLNPHLVHLQLDLIHVGLTGSILSATKRHRRPDSCNRAYGTFILPILYLVPYS